MFSMQKMRFTEWACVVMMGDGEKQKIHKDLLTKVKP